MKLSGNRAGVVLILAGILLSLPLLWGRIKTENTNRRVEILLSPHLGSFEGTIVAEEYTFAELTGLALATRWSPGLEHPFDNTAKPSVVLIFENTDVFAEASSVAKIKFSDTVRTREEGGKYYILFEDRSWSDIAPVGAGIVLPSGLKDKRVYIRPVNDSYVNSRSISRIFDGLSGEGIIFKGEEVLGYPDYIGEVNRHLKTGELVVFNIEFAPQRGMRRVAEGVPVALLHSLPTQLKENVAVRRAQRAMRQRSARGFYFRDLSHAKALSERFRRYVMDIARGRPGGAVIEEPPRTLAFLAVLLVLSGVALLAGLGFKVIFPAVLLLLGAAFIHFKALRSVLVFLSSIAAAPVAVKLAVNRRENMFSALIFIITFSFLGGVLAAVSGWAPEFYTKLTPVRGIKLSFILPVLLGGVMFLGGDLKDNLNKPVKWAQLFAVAGAAAVLGLLVFRSANVRPEFVLHGELVLRNLLEDIFVWRPRFKEFLFAYPLLVAGLYCYYRKKKFTTASKIMLTFGIIGPVSVINSFIHIHTPISGSIIRSFYGWVLGLFSGAVLILIIKRWLPAEK